MRPTRMPFFLKWNASLPVVVVLPWPYRPTIMMVCGRSGICRGVPSSLTSSSGWILMACARLDSPAGEHDLDDVLAVGHARRRPLLQRPLLDDLAERED